MAIAFVGQRGAHVGALAATNTDVLSLASNATAGNMIVCIFAAITSGDRVLSVSDSAGNTWATDSTFHNGNAMIISSTMQDVATLTTSHTVTVTSTGGNFASDRLMWLEEFSGISTGTRVDQQVSSSNAGGTVTNTGLRTPTVNDTLAVALNFHDPASSADSINATGTNATVGTYSSFPTTNQTAINGTRTTWPVYQIISGGSGVGQRHKWSWSTSASGFVGTSFVIYKPVATVTSTPLVLNKAALNRAYRW